VTLAIPETLVTLVNGDTGTSTAVGGFTNVEIGSNLSITKTFRVIQRSTNHSLVMSCVRVCTLCGDRIFAADSIQAQSF
jgi:hypothetical protein